MQRFPGHGDNHVTFYTVGDERYFAGTVGLLNSLRLTGHHHELVVLDNGFTPGQRALLRAHCTLAEKPQDAVSYPWMLKPFPHLLNPTGTVVAIDSDMIVTHSLERILSLAGQGKICAYADGEDRRWFKEWEQFFALRGQLRHQVYVNAGFIAFSTRHWPHLLRRYWEACRAIGLRPTAAPGVPDSPWRAGDQDALNAVLMSEVPAEALAVQPFEEGPNLAMEARAYVRVVDPGTLACVCRGHVTMLLHQCDVPKPWQSRGWGRVRGNAYTRLLPRLLLAPDVALRLAPTDLPLWLRPGVAGMISLGGLSLLNAPTFHRGVKWMLPGWMVRPVQRYRRSMG
jgi:hypothetical protein